MMKKNLPTKNIIDLSQRYHKIATLAICLVFTMSFSNQLNAANGTFGQSADIFNIGAGARSMAMGSAFTGLSDDASAPYFNPAGLAHLDEHQLMAMHAPLFLDSNYNYLSSAHPFGDKWGSFAISDALLQSDKFETRNINNQVTGSEEIRNNVIFASYAHKLFYNISAGINLKFIQQKVVSFSDEDFGADLGFLYTPHRLFNAGVSFANMNSPKVSLVSDEDVFRPITRFGVASEVYEDKVTITADLVKTVEQSALFAAGFEYTPHHLFQIRGGYNANRSYTFGLGVNVKPFRVDYAFSDTDLGSFNKFSFTWAWHNIYKTDLEPPIKEGRAVFPLAGFENRVAFHTSVPRHVVARWSLNIKDINGQIVKTLDGDLRPPDTIVWDARNEVGEPVVQGKYIYDFNVKYKNGKSWAVVGDLDLALPDHEVNEVIDMNLQLNGTQATEEEAQ